MSLKKIALLTALPFIAMAQGAWAQPAGDLPPPAASVSAIQQGGISSEAAVRASLARIEALNHQGPKLNAVIAISPTAIAEAKALDAERRAGHVRGPLHGVPVLIKDNVEVLGMPTTAGSLALRHNDNHRDAPLAAALRKAGAVIVGKTNLSEWANMRSTRSMSGWSAVGGLTRNPYALDRSTCGSSSGSGAAVAAAMVRLAVGTETDGSIICPSSMNGIVGLKPTMGLVPRTHVVPISHSQDIAGPMGDNVRDVAMMFSAMIVADPADPVTRDADKYRHDYAAALDAGAIRGMRVGYMKRGDQPEWAAAFDMALERLKSAGAILVEVTPTSTEGMGAGESAVLHNELKDDLAAYLSTTDPAKVKTRTLSDLIAFNILHADTEMPLFGQESFIKADATQGTADPDYAKARETSLRVAGVEGIDRMLADNDVKLIVMPSYGPAWPSDTIWGDQYEGPYGATGRSAIAGYPHLTVPMGLVDGMPVGLSFLGAAHSEQLLLDAGYAFEQTGKPIPAPDFRPTADSGAALEPAE